MQQQIVDHLAHYGIKGQKWGVRRKRGANGKVDPLAKMSNEELRAINERLSLEQNYKRLNPSKKAKGKKAATEILSTVGIGVSVYNIAKSPAGKAAIDLGKRITDK